MLARPALDHFAAQYGLINRRQARDDLDELQRRQLYRHPDTEWISSRVLHHRAAPESLGSQLLAPVLDAMPRAALWDAPAALWWGFGRDRSSLVTVGRPVDTVRDPLGCIHRVTNFDPLDITEHAGIPIARAERVILGLAAKATRVIHPSRLRALDRWTDAEILRPAVAGIGPILDHAWRLGLIDGTFIHEMCERYEGSGNAGNIVLRLLLDERPPGYLPPGSQLERRFETILGDDAKRIQRQVPLADEGGFVGRVDYRAIRQPVVFEINGETFHTSLSDRAADRARYERLVAMGLTVVIIWEFDVWHTPRTVGQAVRSILAASHPEPGIRRPTPAPWDLLETPERARNLA